jgi:hypothetical protein
MEVKNRVHQGERQQAGALPWGREGAINMAEDRERLKNEDV